MSTQFNRRTFVKSATAGSAAIVASGPLILGAQDKAVAKEPVKGGRVTNLVKG